MGSVSATTMLLALTYSLDCTVSVYRTVLPDRNSVRSALFCIRTSSTDTVSRSDADTCAGTPGAVGPANVPVTRATFVARCSVAPSRVDGPVLLSRFAIFEQAAGGGVREHRVRPQRDACGVPEGVAAVRGDIRDRPLHARVDAGRVDGRAVRGRVLHRGHRGRRQAVRGRRRGGQARRARVLGRRRVVDPAAAEELELRRQVVGHHQPAAAPGRCGADRERVDGGVVVDPAQQLALRAGLRLRDLECADLCGRRVRRRALGRRAIDDHAELVELRRDERVGAGVGLGLVLDRGADGVLSGARLHLEAEDGGAVHRDVGDVGPGQGRLARVRVDPRDGLPRVRGAHRARHVGHQRREYIAEPHVVLGRGVRVARRVRDRERVRDGVARKYFPGRLLGQLDPRGGDRGRDGAEKHRHQGEHACHHRRAHPGDVHVPDRGHATHVWIVPDSLRFGRNRLILLSMSHLSLLSRLSADTDGASDVRTGGPSTPIRTRSLRHPQVGTHSHSCTP